METALKSECANALTLAKATSTYVNQIRQMCEGYQEILQTKDVMAKEGALIREVSATNAQKVFNMHNHCESRLTEMNAAHARKTAEAAQK